MPLNNPGGAGGSGAGAWSVEFTVGPLLGGGEEPYSRNVLLTLKKDGVAVTDTVLVWLFVVNNEGGPNVLYSPIPAGSITIGGIGFYATEHAYVLSYPGEPTTVNVTFLSGPFADNYLCVWLPDGVYVFSDTLEFLTT